MPSSLCEALQPHGIWASTPLHSLSVFVTHCDVDRAGCERAVHVLRDVITKNASRSRLAASAFVRGLHLIWRPYWRLTCPLFAHLLNFNAQNLPPPIINYSLSDYRFTYI